VIASRTLRGGADGLVSVLLPDHLARLGFSTSAIGAIVTATLLGSAATTIAVGFLADRLDRRRVLVGASLLMCATGIGFVLLTGFWPLLAVAIVGTLNPSAGDVSVFLPTEQAALADAVPAQARTAAFARYRVAGMLAGAAGSLAAGVPGRLARHGWLTIAASYRVAFALYAAVGLVVLVLYRGVSHAAIASAPRRVLARSRRMVIELSMLFALDSFGGGFAVQTLLVVWLQHRFGLPLGKTGAILGVAGVLGGLSQLASAPVARRIGHVRTMVFTHLPANVFLIVAGLAPTAPIAVLFLLLRASLSSMDVPARQAFVMAVVPPEERPAAASITNVPRSLASALSPMLAALMLAHSRLGWPLVAGGVLKAIYDLLLLWRAGSIVSSG
jgi:predicted MFS family arabinose efflux permease